MGCECVGVCAYACMVVTVCVLVRAYRLYACVWMWACMYACLCEMITTVPMLVRDSRYSAEFAAAQDHRACGERVRAVPSHYCDK